LHLAVVERVQGEADVRPGSEEHFRIADTRNRQLRVRIIRSFIGEAASLEWQEGTERVKQLLLFGLGLLANTALLVVVVTGFFRASSAIFTRVQHRAVARVIVMALSILMVILSISVGLFMPLFLAAALGLVATQTGSAICVSIASVIGLIVVIYAVRSPAGRRYAQLRVWGRS
jgi:hypothetical protein